MKNIIVYKLNEDILISKAEALVNPINCVGVMSTGLAKKFKEYYAKSFFLF